MVNTVFRYDEPLNEPVKAYKPDSPETASLKATLKSMSGAAIEVPCIVGGEEIYTGQVTDWTAPHDHENIVCRWHGATPEVIQKAIDNGQEAWKEWSETPFHVRISIFRKAAELLAGPWRDRLNASTMLGQSKNVLQAEIDAACELIDFWRYNGLYALRLYGDQPASQPGMWNYVDYRPLEGFVYAVTPFNFTSIGGNLPTAPALMGNVALWKASSNAVLSNYYIMKCLEEAGLPPGVINFVPGKAREVTAVAMGSEHFAGLHYTGSTAVFNMLWRQMAEGLERFNGYPRIVGETGGKDFIFAHESADVEQLAVAAIRGAFEYQGQKCSAASRMYVPSTMWPDLKERMAAEIEQIKMGDIEDWQTFMGAVINEAAYDEITSYVDRAKTATDASIFKGGGHSKEKGWFIEPTVIECENPRYETMTTELFGPVLSVHVYDPARLDETLELCDTSSEYALTGAIFARDRTVAERLATALRHAAGNFYINDKPTGAVVNQQPFGGARGSGTDDKAGSPLNLTRWIAARTVKETFDAPRDWRYPHMA
ncbi:MAG: L-glutamate gamma-semialdehyde dehydrogenase [Planctomycetota bacterium]|nr:L-glutamate gamma-semialdehyde dehydrogenase [Planctomycetota bacterium]